MDNNTPWHIAIAGYSRSGTTMFYQMLRHSVSNAVFYDRECPAHSVVGKDHENRITKRPLDIFQLDEIFEKNVFGKSIHLIIQIRDIRDIVTSRHKSVPDDFFIGYDHQYFINPEQNIVRYTNPGVVLTHRAILHALKDKRFKTTTVLRYEDLVTDPDHVQEVIGTRLNLQFKDRFANFHKYKTTGRLAQALNKQRPVDSENIGRWRKPEYAGRIYSQFKQCPELFDILVAYGYEKDRSWFSEYADMQSSPE